MFDKPTGEDKKIIYNILYFIIKRYTMIVERKLNIDCYKK